jgi:choline dehydrogenase-like flavoprotein
VEADVCVIGAGPVGLTVARALSEKCRTVVLLERGGTQTSSPTEDLDIAFDRGPYRGATSGRAFGPGGTSALWGGQLLPMREADLDARAQIGAPHWPISYADLEPHFLTLESWLKVMPGTFGLDYARRVGHPLAQLSWGQWSPRFSKWIPLGRRNLQTAFSPVLARLPSLREFLNARVCEWKLEQGIQVQRVTEITARSPMSRGLRVSAKAYVICAGALESARCVLELNDAAGGLGSGVEQWAGRNLHDHLSIRLARVRILDHPAFCRLFAPSFVGSTMRSLRMELDPRFMEDRGLPALYTHFVAQSPPNSGFAVLRESLRAFQRHDVGTALRGFVRLPAVLPGLARIAFDRFVRRQLSFPRDAEVFLHYDAEQSPSSENRVRLWRERPGTQGRLDISWSPRCDIPRLSREVKEAFDSFWERNGLGSLASIEPLESAFDPETAMLNLYDIYHPAGTARMSADSGYGVVDPNLQVYGTGNAFVVGSAVFPSMGAANPTFTAMALGLRLAEFIHRRFLQCRIP